MILPKPYYQDSFCTIYLGDSLELLPQMPKVDLVLTDPPYGINKEKWDVEYLDNIENLFFSIARKVCIIPGIWALGKCIEAMGDKYKWVIAGHKSAAMTNGRLGLNKWQPAVVGGNIGFIGQDAFDFSQRDNGKCGHPCQKPLEFIKWLVAKLSNLDDLILDPFLGSGTTLVAAKQLNRKAIGIEIEEKYCEIAAKRLSQEVFNFRPRQDST